MIFAPLTYLSTYLSVYLPVCLTVCLTVFAGHERALGCGQRVPEARPTGGGPAGRLRHTPDIRHLATIHSFVYDPITTPINLLNNSPPLPPVTPSVRWVRWRGPRTESAS